MKIEEIKDIDIKDESRHYNMISEKGGTVHFAISAKKDEDGNTEMCACDWNAPKEGKVFLKELEKYADEHGFVLTISNVINPALENILRKAGNYEEIYEELSYLDGDTIQIFKRKKGL